MSVGEQIRRYRIQAGLTQHELSQRSGVCQPTIGSYEGSYIATPSETNLESIASALGVTSDDLWADLPADYTSPVKRRISRSQQVTLIYVEEFIRDNGRLPSIRVIQEALGYKSPSTVVDHLQNLRAQGKLPVTDAQTAIYHVRQLVSNGIRNGALFLSEQQAAVLSDVFDILEDIVLTR